MVIFERLEKIKDIIRQKKSVDVPTLSKELSVSEVTIRRDLQKLEEQGFIIKTYGGAVLKEDSEENSIKLINTRRLEEDDNIEHKREIAKVAASIISDHDVIFLGSGNTCLNIATNIKNKKGLVVVTNDIFIALELHDLGNIKVVVTGGDVIPFTGSLTGDFCLNNINKIFIHKAFFSIRGADFKLGYTVNSKYEAEIYKAVMQISKRAILVADYEKFGNTGLIKLCELKDIKEVITNKRLPDVYKKYYFDNYIKVYTSYKIE